MPVARSAPIVVAERVSDLIALLVLSLVGLGALGESWRVVGAGALIDRSGGAADLGLPRAALLTLQIQNYHPAECPLCQSGSPAVKPGSRTKK